MPKKIKRKFLISRTELDYIKKLMSSNDVESRLLGLSLLETSNLGRHYFLEGKHNGIKFTWSIEMLKITLNKYPLNFYHLFESFWKWVESKTYN